MKCTVLVRKIGVFLVVPVFIGCMFHKDVPSERMRGAKLFAALALDYVDGLKECVGGDANVSFAPYEYVGYSLSRPAVMWALESGATNCVEWLLMSGADIGIRDSDGNTALMMCYGIPDCGVLDWADRIHGIGLFDVNEQNILGQTALFYALIHHNRTFAKWCLRHKADVCLRAYLGEGMIVPISFLGLQSQYLEEFMMVVKSESFDVTATDSHGNNPLLVLDPIIDDYELRVKFLMNKGANVNAKGRNGNVLCYNMKKLKRDCSERIKFLCNYPLEMEILEDALMYAKAKKYRDCTTILEKCIGEKRASNPAKRD